MIPLYHLQLCGFAMAHRVVSCIATESNIVATGHALKNGEHLHVSQTIEPRAEAVSRWLGY
jgi:hypothetical protein